MYSFAGEFLHQQVILMSEAEKHHYLSSTMNEPESIRTDLGSLSDLTIFAIIAFVACLIYAKSLAYQYTYFDDIFLLVVNKEFLSNLANLPRLFSTDVFIAVANPEVFYRPLMNILFMLEMQLSDNSTAIFHLTNILLHIGCSLLVFVVLKQLRVSKGIAAAAAILFCAHPLNTSAVVWIPGRNDTLLTLLVLASFSMLIRALDAKHIWPLVGHMVFFFLALLTKEVAIALPILAASYVVLVRKERLSRNIIAITTTSYILLIAAWFALRSLVPRTLELHQSSAELAIDWLKNSPAFILYFGKAILPFNLSVFPNLTDQSLIYGVVAVLLFALLYFLGRPASNRLLLWGLGWYFFFLAPSLLSGTIFFEHRNYCSFVGLLIAIVELPMIQKINFARPIHVFGLVALFALLGVLAMFHSEHFRNRYSFATSAFTESPSVDESYSALAGFYLDDREYDDAERVLQAGIARNPVMRTAHRMLGDVYAKRRKYALAANEYETSIRLEPLQLYTYINYGKMCLQVGKLDDAVRLWKRSVLLNPEFLPGYEYLTNFYLYTRNDPDSAMIYARQIQQRGVTVLPELLHDIQNHPLYGKRKQ